MQKIFKDNGRTIAIRSQQEAAASVSIRAVQGLPQPAFPATNSRSKSTATATAICHHLATSQSPPIVATIAAALLAEFLYTNHFAACPAPIPFRPATGRHPSRLCKGTQTAVVVGPAGEERFFTTSTAGSRSSSTGTAKEEGRQQLLLGAGGPAWAGKGWGRSLPAHRP